jgi:hypothetical protein
VTFPAYDPVLASCMLVVRKIVLQISLQISLCYLGVLKNEGFIQFSLDLTYYNAPGKRMVVVVFLIVDFKLSKRLHRPVPFRVEIDDDALFACLDYMT